MRTYEKFTPKDVTIIIQTLKASRRPGARELAERIEQAIVAVPPVDLELIGPDDYELGNGDDDEDEPTGPRAWAQAG